MKRYFCTYFDSRFVSRGLALYQSLRAHCTAFELWILCLDDECYKQLQSRNLANIRLISIGTFEAADAALRAARKNRSLVEYYFTCTPVLPEFVLRIASDVDLVTYLDADLFFYSDPEPLYAEMGDASIAIIAHRFPPRLRWLECTGIYNVGWLSFRRDGEAARCLAWWRERCIEWCSDAPDTGRFADQKYLDDWRERFRGVHVLQHKGADVAPWNLSNYTAHLRNGQVYVDEYPLVFFHFHGFQQLRPWLYDPNLARYGARSSRVIRTQIIAPYIRMLLTTGGRRREANGLRTLRGDEFRNRSQLERGRWQVKEVLRAIRYRRYSLYVNGNLL